MNSTLDPARSHRTRQFVICSFEADARAATVHSPDDSSRIKINLQSGTTHVRLSLEEGLAKALHDELLSRLVGVRSSSHHRAPIATPVDEAYAIDFKDGRTLVTVKGSLDIELTLSNTTHFVRLLIATNVAAYILEDLHHLLPDFASRRAARGEQGG